MSALIRYTVDMSCVTGGKYFIATELQKPVHQLTNQVIIEGSAIEILFPNLRPGTTYYFCVIISNINENYVKLCGNDLPAGGVFTTNKPDPPAELNGAVLVFGHGMSDVVMYECNNDLDRFNDGCTTTIAKFDSTSQAYTLNDSCSCEYTVIMYINS